MFLDLLAAVGRDSVAWLWAPVAMWTGAAVMVLAALRLARGLHPLMGYRLRQAILLALPVSVGFGPWLHRLAGAPTLIPRLGVGLAARPIEVLEAAPVANVVTAQSTDPVGILLGTGVVLVLLVAARRGAALVRRLNQLKRLSALASPVTDPVTLSALRDLQVRLHVERRVKLLEAPSGAIPMTFGWARPTIVVDGQLVLAPDRLRIALAHELIHVRRGDGAWAVAEAAVAAIGGAHPLVSAIARDIDRHREASCDAELVGSGVASPRVYAQLLCDFGLGTAPALPAPGLLARPSNLKRRLEIMKRVANDPEPRRLRPLSAAAGTALFLAVVALGACAGHADSPPAPEADIAQQLTSQFGPMADETRDAALERLEVQMGYLTERIEGMTAQFEATQTGGRDVAPHIYEQYQLLNDMYLQRLQTYETLKLERETEIRLGRIVRKQ